ncbi:hypothetical protein ACFOSC_26460 [Streptantibioticus rubrisoli]|uniref:Uncharacterized protein n=1 Tax=Streptantibioticus rubrisoli TaxID=1387313 RepID=A0ABT1PEU2_9ACTN|nr:hypothetical protein [Streptantibioticus rubrisoli]MCQ4043879.1 hypothetical protein [Streptantibioticus rubrisoli]
MKWLAVALLIALLLHFPFLGRLAAVAPVLGLHAVAWALGQGWLLASALAAVSWRMAARRWGWL